MLNTTGWLLSKFYLVKLNPSTYIRTKVTKCCANIYFNWQYLTNKVVPKYANMKIPYTSPATNITQEKIQTIRLKDEIKFLYTKKWKLNNDLYSIHLKAAQVWGTAWYITLDCIHESINQEFEKKYKTIEEKRKKILHNQTKNPDCKGSLYNTTFTSDNLTLLNKGLKYNLNHKQRMDKNSCPGSWDRYNSITYSWTRLHTLPICT